MIDIGEVARRLLGEPNERLSTNTELRFGSRGAISVDLCGAHRPRLGLNAVGGASALNLANALSDFGVLVTYGAMARQPLKIPNGLLIFRNLEFKGFWASRWLRSLSPDRPNPEQLFSQPG